MTPREHLPRDRRSVTKRFELRWPEKICEECGAESRRSQTLRVYVTVGFYDDGRPGEIFFSADRMGRFPHGMLCALAMATSIAWQHGVPLESTIKQWRATKFPPEGFTGEEEFPLCTSLLDYVAQWLEARFVRKEKP